MYTDTTGTEPREASPAGQAEEGWRLLGQGPKSGATSIKPAKLNFDSSPYKATAKTPPLLGSEYKPLI